MDRSILIAALPIVALALSSAAAEGQDSAPKPRDLNTRHLFQPPADRKTWEARRAELRRRILFSAGLWPMPEKTPLNPRITGRTIGPDYVIENVYIETVPGFYLCGNVYLPRGKKGPFPGIVNPHGHWAQGRVRMEPDVPKAAPPPAAPAPGRGNLVAIGVSLARQGFVCFAYDMVGYADTTQIDHKFAGTLNHWLWGVSLNGLQLWDSIRATDYLASRPEVNPKLLGCTGASGGGTQTFELAAVDDRIAVAAPVNMISATMQGGCLCENGPGLRIGTDNVEIGAMMAPRPLLDVACTGDWTKNAPTEEWPAIRKVYDLYGAADHTAVVQFNYEHNFNVESREAVYAWFGKWLKGDDDASHYREQPFEIDAANLHVWREDAKRPDGALDAQGMLKALQERAAQRLASAWPTSREQARRFREAFAPALATSLAVEVPAALKRTGKPSLLIVTSLAGHSLASTAAAGLEGRYASVDVLPMPIEDDDPGKLWADYYSTYNRTPAGNRVQHILKALRAARSSGGKVDLVAIGESGPYALLAAALSPDVRKVAVDLAGFDVASDEAYLERLYAPGLAAAGGIATAAALCAPNPLCLFGVAPSFPSEPLKEAYAASGASCRIEARPLGAADIVAWLRK